MEYLNLFEDGFSYRLGNIEIRKIKGYNENYHIEIVKWYDNPHFGKENEFIFDETRKMYRCKNNNYCMISPSSFKYKELCYTISWVKDSSEEPNIESIGSRPYDLNEEEWLNYHKVMKYFYEQIYKRV